MERKPRKKDSPPWNHVHLSFAEVDIALGRGAAKCACCIFCDMRDGLTLFCFRKAPATIDDAGNAVWPKVPSVGVCGEGVFNAIEDVDGKFYLT